MDESKIDLTEFRPTAPDAKEPEPAGALIEKLRESEAPLVDVGDGILGLKTNEGLVIIGSPADQVRLAMFRGWKRSGGRDLTTEQLDALIDAGERDT